jgi:hypothetical protein
MSSIGEEQVIAVLEYLLLGEEEAPSAPLKDVSRIIES